MRARAELAKEYRKLRKLNPRNKTVCNGEVDSRFVIDYRCTTPNGKLGTSYPAPLMRCMERVSNMTAEEIMVHYGLSNGDRAKVLKRRTDGEAEREAEKQRLPRSTMGGLGRSSDPCLSAQLQTCWHTALSGP